MSDQKKVIINAELKTTLSNMDQTISELEKGLSKQKFDIGKTSNLSKLIKEYKNAKEELEGFMEGGQVSSNNTKKFIAQGEKIGKLYRQIGEAFKQIQDGSFDTLKKLFPSNFNAQIEKGTKAISNFFEKIETKNIKQSKLDLLNKDVISLNSELEELRGRRIKIEIEADKKKVQNDLDEVARRAAELQDKLRLRLIPEEAKNSKGQTRTTVLEQELEKRRKTYDTAKDLLENLRVEQLSKAQLKKIAGLEGQLKGSEGEDLLAIETKRLKDLRAEKSARATIAQVPGAQDRGRNARTYGKVTDKELDAQIAASKNRLKQLNDIAQQIEDIRIEPQKAYEVAKATAESAAKRAKTNLDKTEQELEAHRNSRQILEAEAEAKASNFMAGQDIAEATDAERQALADLNDERERARKELEALNEEKSFRDQDSKDKSVQSKEHDLAQKQIQIQKIKSEIGSLNVDTDIDKIFDKLEELNIPVEGIERSAEGLRELQKELTNLNSTTVEKIKEDLIKLGYSGEEAEKIVHDLGAALNRVELDDENLRRSAQEIDNLKNQVLDFFSLTNSVELFKRAINSAIETVRELDKVMTETAVVTDFSIGDMWDKLPDYADRASNLGTSIAELYSATTLYYQQGLKTNEAMGVGVETMKMARIANMDATDATTAMTAALRGFNMAVNEMNAQKVNDVYSELAAITAADTNQIATAMGKTASIAASANMEFETTAAFLAQIIETTQEAPETAGTALKTIIARFTEVKELFSEGMLTGKDSEGEEININKIDKALHTVGISLKDFLNGTKGMDDIFLELASKWESLDLATQRYIATTAAGSRQQSRFIAMMSNYGRTMELVNAANNSAGASQEQYAKTLESLDTKLQQLKNAWDTYAMGLANDETIKLAVDTLTWILEKINLIIEGISGGNGIIKSLTSLGVAFGALKIGGTTFEALFDTVKKAASESGLGAGNTFSSVFQNSLKERFGKSGDYFKKLFPSRKQWKNLIGKDLASAFDFDFNNTSSGQIKKFGDSIWKDFETSLIGKKIELTELDKIKEDFFKSFNTGKAEQGLLNLANKAEELGVKLELSKSSAKATTSTIESGFGKAAAAVAGVSLALTFLTKQLEKTGHERGAEGFEVLASGASVLAGILAMLPGLLKTFGVAASAAGPVGWVITAITGLVTLCIALEKWIESDTEKLERLNKEAQEAADTAKEAKEAYDSLLSNKSEYSELQEELEKLIKGTDEWRRKLIEANQQVLELINTYPELAQYISRGAQGQLVITDEGWDQLERTKQEQIINTQAMSSMANINVIGEEQKQKLKKTEKEFYKALPGVSDAVVEKILNNAEVIIGATAEEIPSVLSEDQKQRLWEQLGYTGKYNETELKNEIEYDDNLKIYNKELINFANSIGVTASNLYDSANIIKDYYSYMQKETLATETNLSAFLGASTVASNSKYGDQIAQAIASQNIWKIDDKIETRTKELKASPYLATKYEGATGRDSENMSEEDMANALAKIEIGKELSGQVDQIINYLDGMTNQEQAGQVASILSGDISDFTATEADKLVEDGLSDDLIKEILAATGYENLEALAAANGMSEEEYKAYLLEPFKDLSSKMKALFSGDIDWAGGKTHLENATYGQQQAYANFAHQTLGVLGEASAKNLVGIVDKLLVDEKTRDQVFELLGDTNFRKEGAAEEFIADLERIGVDMGNINIDSFVQDLNKLNASFKKFDLKSLMDQSKKLLDLSDSLKTRNAEEGLTDEERTELLTVPGIKEEDFAWTGQEWIYLGDTMEGLSRALRENTEAILEQKMAGLEEQIATGEKLQEIFGDDNSFDIAKWGDRGQKIFESLSLEEFLKGREGTLTAADIRSIFGDEAGTTDDEAWALFDKYKFAHDNLISNKNTYDLYSQNMGTAIAMSGYLGQAKGTTEDYETAVDAKERILGTEQLAETLEGLFDSEAKKAEGFDTAIRALAADLGASQKNMKSFVETLGDVKDSLTEGKRGTEEYSSAWQKVEDSLKNVFGKNALEGIDIPQELMEKMVSGSEEAFAEVEKIIQANAQKNLEVIVKQTAGTLDGLQAALPELQTNIITTYDPEQLTTIFGKIITQADDAAAEARARIAEDLLGYGLQVAWSLDEEGKVTAAEIVNIDRGNLFKNYSRSSGGGGSSKWENPYDKLYNTVQRINAELRLRERLEREYQRLLNNSVISSAELAKNSREQIASLEYEKKTREYLLEKRREEMALLSSEFSDVAHYASWDENIGVMLNQEALAKLDGSTNEKLTSKVEKYISKMEEKAEQIYEEADAIDEIKDTVKEIQEQGKDEYIDFENQVKDALIFEREQEIEKLTEINETINDSNSKLISAMQESISKERQARENNKTEEELEEKRQRLAQLRMDTSGANALEILALEKEIAEQEQGYIDTLVDQKIQALQDQNEKAYEQRQHQIEILQWQKKFWEDNGDIWKDVQKVVQEGYDSEKGIINGSTLQKILQNKANFSGLSAIGQQEWWKDLTETLTAAFGYLEVNQQLEDIGATAGEKIKFKYGNKELSGTINKDGSVTTDDGRVFNNIYKGFGGYYAGKNIEETQREVQEESLYGNKYNNTGAGNNLNTGGITYRVEDGVNVAQVQRDLYTLGYYNGPFDGIYGAQTAGALREFIGKEIQTLTNTIQGRIHKYVLEEHGIAFAAGGLADFTGPAWLDGTKAKPEYVLNAAQTERFFALVDILDSWKNLDKDKNIQNNGDNIVDIDINIETVKEEADVDMLAEKVQHAIVTSARYRNNSFIQR